jgi:hypothetical protein
MPFDGVGYITSESLERIDAVIDLMATPDKWCKGALRSIDGRYCLRGAILAENAAALLEAPVLQAIQEVSGRRYQRIESFNDDPKTDHAMITTVLLRARYNITTGNVAAPASGICDLRAPGAWRLVGLRQALHGWFRAALGT